MSTKCEKNRAGIRLSLALCILTTIVVCIVAGCLAVPTPDIGQPRVSVSTPLKPEQEAGISVDVTCAADVTLTYTWSADGGEIKLGQGSPAITYRAPDTPGTYNVKLTVEWDGQKVERATSITVEKETLTPTLVPPAATPVLPPPTLSSPTETPAAPSPTIGPTLQPASLPPSEAITDPSTDAEVGTPITVKGKWMEAAERGDLHLEVLVRSLQPNEPYWVQSRPKIVNGGTWHSSPVHVGRPGMDVGTRFEICVVATGQDLTLGQQLYELPEGPNFCIEVTRR